MNEEKFKHLKKIESEKEFLQKEKEYMKRLTKIVSPHNLPKILYNPTKFNDQFLGLFDEMEYIGLISEEDKENYIKMYLKGINMPSRAKHAILERYNKAKGSMKKKIKGMSKEVQNFLQDDEDDIVKLSDKTKK